MESAPPPPRRVDPATARWPSSLKLPVVVRLEVVDPQGVLLAAVDVPPGERLIDALDDARAPVELGCRSATCGICMVEVVAGAAALAAPDPIERIALEDLGAAAGDRLACRAAIGAPADGASVRLRPRSPARRLW